ncbi:MAG: hypothetical protein FI699_07345 [SAR202 cluster bacterium]|nr:hypothetical protein [SAR202 cluster bacterium]|tara:strand:- start:1417 stop:1749 length:333 start_codon:yes stop_codon:yes gene_type:complete
MKSRDLGRFVGILGAALVFFSGCVSIILGLVDSTPEQSGNALVSRGLILVSLSCVAGYGARVSFNRPSFASVVFIGTSAVGCIVAFRSFAIAGFLLLIASAITYSNRYKG